MVNDLPCFDLDDGRSALDKGDLGLDRNNSKGWLSIGSGCIAVLIGTKWLVEAWMWGGWAT